MVVFLGASTGAFVRAYLVPSPTVEGELAAAPWRGYATSVSDRAYEPNLDTDLPYLVGLGLVGKLAPCLKAASEKGVRPVHPVGVLAVLVAGHVAADVSFSRYRDGWVASSIPTAAMGL